ncbi:DUF4942 domain-containing protein [Escherichia fergusonii]|nr:DUF4942 domain-containing protein [Escherichia fergusonii]MDN4047072.1 DUF4942 domain-containing protein [Escherichia fergusonii]
MQPNAFGLPSSLDRTIEEGRKEIDRKTWKRLFEETGMDRYWNHKQKEAFNESLRTDPPVASLEIVKGTLQHALANRRDTLAEGFVDVLNKRKRTARAVLTGMCYSAGSAMRHGSSSLTRLTGQSAMTPSTWRR